MMRPLVLMTLLTASFAAPTMAHAADELVMQSATGSLASYRGKPWYEPMLFCAAFHQVDAGRRPEPAAGAGRGRSAEFSFAVAIRVSEDRGMTVDDGMRWAASGLKTRAMGISMQWVEPRQFEESTKACNEIMAAYDRAF